MPKVSKVENLKPQIREHQQVPKVSEMPKVGKHKEAEDKSAGRWQ
jgi:hypothetical protein